MNVDNKALSTTTGLVHGWTDAALPRTALKAANINVIAFGFWRVALFSSE
jgi:hypothetical protein